MNRRISSTNTRRKLIIKPYKAPVAPPPDHFATSSNLLIEATRAILYKRNLSSFSADKAKLSNNGSGSSSNSNSDPTSVADAPQFCTSREELYRLVESLCLDKVHRSKLFGLLETEIESAAKVILNKLTIRTSLEDLLELYEEYSQYVFYIRNIFLPLDRSEKKNIYEVGKQKFRALMVEKNLFQENVMPNLLRMFADLRADAGNKLMNGEVAVVETNFCMKRCIQMIQELSFFDTFVELFFEESRTSYSNQSNHLIATFTLPEYFVHTQKLINFNSAICVQYFNRVKYKLTCVMEECLVKAMQPQIFGEERAVESSFHSLLDDIDKEYGSSSLTIGHHLFRKIGELEEFEKRIIEWGKARGSVYITDGNPIPKLLVLYSKLCTISDVTKNKTITKSVMESVLNEGNNNKVPQALAKQFNIALCKKDRAEMEDLSSLFKLFTCLVDKDVFGAHYKRLLGKRLLHNTSLSLDLEKSILGKLKSECGAQYTAKLEGMYKDIELAVNVRQVYFDYCQNDVTYANPIEFEPTVLTMGYWQQPPQHESIILPDMFVKHMNHYNKYYTEKYKGRRIVWQHSLGFVNIKAKFAESRTPYILVLPTSMALVLIQFNSKDNISSPTLSVHDLMKATGLPMEEVVRCLISLSKTSNDKSKNHRLLVHQRKEQTQAGIQRNSRYSVLPGDTFTVNSKYKSKSIRMKINLVSTKQELTAREAEEDEQVAQAVSRDRANAIDAMIVRLMKTRKVMKHQELLAELLSSGGLKFNIQTSEVKKRIESLIEREYMERSKDNRNVYNYLA